jgi:hypothetical protein
VDNKMTNEQMDALFRRVFGEEEAGDQQLLDAGDGGEVTQAMAQELVVLGNLKSELKALGDIPECQLNSSRVKDAILGQGIPESRTSWFASWGRFALPVAACAALAVFLMNPNRVVTTGNGESSPVVASMGVETHGISPMARMDASRQPRIEQELGLSQPNTAPQSSNGGALNSGAGEPAQGEVSRANRSGVRSQVRRTPKRSQAPRYASAQPVSNGASLTMSAADISAKIDGRGGVGSGVTVDRGSSASSAVASIAAGAIEGFSRRESADNATPGAMMAAPVGMGEAGKVVIVGAGTDPQTRASAATEVDKRNVVFGG